MGGCVGLLKCFQVINDGRNDRVMLADVMREAQSLPVPSDIRGGPCHCSVTQDGCLYLQEYGTPFCVYCNPTHYHDGQCACPCRACDPTGSDWSSNENESEEALTM